ncbi:hypothetical protein VPHD479_0396 [Vibrio phage D479]
MNDHIKALAHSLAPYGYEPTDVAGGDDFDTKERIFPYSEATEIILTTSKSLGYSVSYDEVYYFVLAEHNMLSISDMLNVLDGIAAEEDDFADYMNDEVYPE